MFDVPRPVLLAATILTIAAGVGMLVFAWQLPANIGGGTIRPSYAGGGTFLLIAGLLGTAVLGKTKGTGEDDEAA